MKRILSIAGLTLAFTGTASAADLGFTYDLSNVLAPTAGATTMGASYYLDDSTEIPVGIDMSVADGFALNNVSLGYWKHGGGVDEMHAMMGANVNISDVTGDLGLGLNCGIGFQAPISFFDGAAVRAVTGLDVGVTGGFSVQSVSSNLMLHYRFGM